MGYFDDIPGPGSQAVVTAAAPDYFAGIPDKNGAVASGTDYFADIPAKAAPPSTTPASDQAVAEPNTITGKLGEVWRGIDIKSLPADVGKALVGLIGATESPKAFKQAWDVLHGVPVAQAIPESQTFVGIENKPIEERIKTGFDVATNLGFLKGGEKAVRKAAGTVPAPVEAPPVVGNEQFARVNSTPEQIAQEAQKKQAIADMRAEAEMANNPANYPAGSPQNPVKINEGAGAAVPADNPAPAQSTILETPTQPEPKPVVPITEEIAQPQPSGQVQTLLGLMDAWDKNPNDPILDHVIRRTIERFPSDVRDEAVSIRMARAPITEENAAQAATDIGGLSFGGVQSWPADSGIPSTLEFTITEPGKETTLSVPPGITPEELIARRDQKLADFAAKEQSTEPAAAQPEPAPQEAPVSGINNERLYQIYGKDAVVSGKGNGPKRLQEMGRADTRDPYSVLSNAQRNGIATGADVAKLRDEHNRLLDVARNSYGTPQYPELAQRAVDMANAIKGVAHGPASEVFRALQEADIPRYTSPADFDNIVRERMKRESTPEEQAAFKKVTDEVNNGDREAVQAATSARTLLRKSRLRAAKEPMQFDDAADYIRKQITDLTKDCVV